MELIKVSLSARWVDGAVDVEITHFLVEEPRIVRSTREPARVKLRLQRVIFYNN